MARFRIEHRLGIPAPAPVAWRVLSDLEHWAGWNPLYVKAEGVLRIGTQLTLTQALEGRATVLIQPTIVDWVPDAQILWRLTQNSGLVQRMRYLEIDKLSDEACIFSNGEDWSGLLAGFVPVELRKALRKGYEAMGEALRDQALQLWRAEGGKPTSASA
jgi:hypothetical protein